jgi:hypothetical protein
MDQVQVELECQVRRSAAANTTFKMASSDKPLKNCASKGPPLIPLKAAARGVTSAGSAGPHREPLAPTPCGTGSLRDEPREILGNGYGVLGKLLG